MRNYRLPTVLAAAVALAAAQVSFAAAAKGGDAAGFKPLFNGRDLSGFKVYPEAAEQAYKVADGVITVSGHPNGFLCTDKSYKNYVVRYDWQYKRPAGLEDDLKFLGNSGCLVHVREPGQPAVGGVWPQCVEVQGMNRDHGTLLFLKTKGENHYDRDARNRAAKPVGEWNTTEITCLGDGSITVKINGTQVTTGRSDLTEGQIAWQSEGAEIHFRNIMIKELP